MSRYDFTGIAEWNEIPGWFDLAKAVALQLAVKTLPRGSTVVELGSFLGRSSVAIAAVLPEGATLHCVDHFRGSPEHLEMKLDLTDLFNRFVKNLEMFGVRERVAVLRMSTLEAAARFEEHSVDLILLDAAHDCESVGADLEAWYPRLKPGGLLFCDDYEESWPGVIRAVQAAGLDGKLVTRALWQHRKPM